MPCHHIDLGNGTGAIVCTGRARIRRCACGRPADRLCDWKVPTKKSGTCDKPVCSQCSTSPAPEKDLCATHAEAFEHWKRNRA